MLKYICISDQHTGADMSLVTNHSDASPLSPVTKAFATSLNALLAQQSAKPQLIVLGDLLDLQFSDRGKASKDAINYLKALNSGGMLADEMIATAGNHDHALWTDARLGIDAKQLTASGDDVTYRHTTPAFSPDPDANSRLLTEIAQRADFKSVDLRYPNIGFGDRNRAVFLHHGHFIESPYRVISRLRDYLCGINRQWLTAEEISKENAGWIDFFWPSFGETGFADEGYDTYQNLLTSAGFRTLSKRWSATISETLSEALPLSGNLTLQKFLHMAIQVGFDATLGQFRDTERAAIVESLTTEGWHGLQWYLDGVAQQQISQELGGEVRDLTFVFGHTHKPFADWTTSRASPRPIKTFNTGGWTLNGPRLDNQQGASMVLIDQDLNTLAVKLFSTPMNGEVAPAFVQHLSDETEGAQKFAAEVTSWINQTTSAWSDLAHAAREAYQIRQQMLLDKTNPDAKAAS